MALSRVISEIGYAMSKISRPWNPDQHWATALTHSVAR